MRRRALNKLFLSGLFLLAAVVNLLAGEYPVSTVAELNALTLNPGDVVILKNGVWVNAALVFNGTGTESMPITLRAEEGGKVLLTGNSTLQIGGEYLVVDGLVFTEGYLNGGHIIEFRTSSGNPAYHCRLTNTKIKDYNPASPATEYKWVSLYGQYNRVDHCHFEGKTNLGTTLVVWLDNQPNYHLIDHNYFGPRPDLGENGGETIRIGTSDWSMYDSYTTVEMNLFDECDGEIEIISNKSCKNVYRYNTFRNSAGTLTLRHGNNCEVYGNFFFGSADKQSGGIRIIGEGHRVYNNYLQDIPGSGFRAAICLTNGVPDSPLNRYFRVISAQVINNTLVNCTQPIAIGAGKDSELSLPPLDCELSNNVVAVYSSSTTKIIDYVDEPVNMVYRKNIMFGAPLGIPSQEGILEEDPELILSDIWRPAETSNVLGYGMTDFTFVSHDIDGQTRTAGNDAGCDQLSAEALTNRPLNTTDVGVQWVSQLKEVPAADGGSVLRKYITEAKDGDEIVLTTSGGVYQLDSSAVLSADIVIRAKYGLAEKPVITAAGAVDEFILLDADAGLWIEGIDFNGGGLNDAAFKSAFTTSPSLSGNDTIALEISKCRFSDFTNAGGGYILRSLAPVVFRRLYMQDVQVFDVAKQAVIFGNHSHADSLVFANCTFVNVGREVLLMDLDVQGEATARLNHCTIDSVGFTDDGYEALSLINVDATIRNTLFTNSGAGTSILSITGAASDLDYCLFWKTSAVSATNGAVSGSSLIQDQDVYYSDRSRYFFSLLPVSPALHYADDGDNLGDLYWNDHGILGDNAYLSAIKLDYKSISGFVYNTFDYDLIVNNPASYVITAVRQDYSATALIGYPDEIPGLCTITVTAENKITTQVYNLHLMPDTGSGLYDINNGGTGFLLYPNPCEDILVIESEDCGYALIYDLYGRLVKELKIDAFQTQHAVSDLEAGYYNVVFDTPQKRGSKVLIII